MYVTTWPISKRGNKWEILSYEAWMDGRTEVCHNKPVFWRAYKNEWPISWNYEYIIFGQIIFQNFHQFKAFVGLSNYRTVGLSDCRIITTAPYNQCLSPLMLWVRISIRARYTTLCDKVCQWLATGRWFSPGTPVSSINKTDSHIITEILLKVSLNTIKPNQPKH